MKLLKKLSILSSTIIGTAALTAPVILSSCSSNEKDPNPYNYISWTTDTDEVNLGKYSESHEKEATVIYKANVLSPDYVERYWPEIPDEPELATFMFIEPTYGEDSPSLKITFSIGWKECKGEYVYEPVCPIWVRVNGKEKKLRPKLPPVKIYYAWPYY